MARTIVDACPLLALFNRNDAGHKWAVEVFGGLLPPLFTTEPVLTEVAYFLTEAGIPIRRLLEWIENGDLKIPFQLAEQARAVALLMDKYGRRMDLADATLVRLSELFDDCRVLTLHRQDFSIYRRHGRQVIPLLTLPD